MSLTQEEITALRQKIGVPASGVGAGGKTAADRINAYKQRSAQAATAAAVTGNQFTSPTPTPQAPSTLDKVKGFAGKVRDVAVDIVGGEKLAEGAGLALAAPKLQRDLSAAEQQMSDTDLQLVKRIREKKERGEDTSRLENARMLLREDMVQASDVQQGFIDALPSNEQVIGSAVRLGATVAAPSIVGGVAPKGSGVLASNVTKVGGIAKAVGPGVGILSGAGKGALTGASVGAVEGAIHGAGHAMEEDKSAGEVLQSSLAGAGMGAAGGAIFGAAAGAIGGKMNANAVKKEEFAQDFVMQKQTAKVKADAIEQGRFTDPTFLQKSKITPSGQEKKLAKAVEGVVSPDKTLGENIDAVKSHIDEVNTGVKDYITKNKVPFNRPTLRKQLMAAKGENQLVFASDETAERTFDAVVDEFMRQVDKGDTAGLFEARQHFDQVPAIKKLLNTQGLGENVRRQIVLDVRRAANEYIAEQLPKGNSYRGLLKLESYMIEAIGNAAERNASIIGKNNLQLLTEKVPLMKWIVGSVIGGGVAGGLGAGAAMIGSTD